MRVLLDTHVLLWALTDSPKMLPRHREIIVDPRNTVSASAINIAEIAIKSSIGKMKLSPMYEQDNYAGLLHAIKDSGLELLPFEAGHAARLRSLPFHHRDPFDRMLIVQALHEDYIVLTVDSKFADYPITVG